MKGIALLCFILSVLFCYPGNAFAIDIEVTGNKIYGLHCFLNSLAKIRYGSPITRKRFETSKYNTAHYGALVSEYNKIYKNHITPHGFLFKGYPHERSDMLWNMERFFLLQSAKSKSLEDFSSRTASILPHYEYARFFSIMKEFEPIYEELILQPYLEKFEYYRQNFVKLSQKPVLDSFFSKAAAFYHADAPEQAITVALHPVPAQKGRLTAAVIENTALIPILADSKDWDVMFGVFLHELCHSFYSAQSAEFQKQVVQSFMSSQLPRHEDAMYLFNEALATAIGNGWGYELINGKENRGEWYNRPLVDTFAKVLFPQVVAYLEENKPMDREFIVFAQSKYKELFSQ